MNQVGGFQRSAEQRTISRSLIMVPLQAFANLCSMLQVAIHAYMNLHDVVQMFHSISFNSDFCAGRLFSLRAF